MIWMAIRLNIPVLSHTSIKKMKNIADKSGSLIIKEKNKNLKILFYATRQDMEHLNWGVTLAHALRLRGHRCTYFSCDGLLRKSCNTGFYPELCIENCKKCSMFAKKFISISDLPSIWLSRYVTRQELIEAEETIGRIKDHRYDRFEYNNLSLGKMAEHSVAHFLKGAS